MASKDAVRSVQYALDHFQERTEKAERKALLAATKQAWMTNDAEIEEMEALEKLNVEKLSPTVSKMLPGQAVQIFAIGPHGEICKAFGIIHRSNKEHGDWIAISLNNSNQWHHECNGFCKLDDLYPGDDDVYRVQLVSVKEICVQANSKGTFWQVKI